MKKRLKLNIAFRGYPVGTVIGVDVNSDGMPVDPFWRRRVVDAEIDKCVEFVDDVKPEKPAKPAKSAKPENKEE